MKSSGVVKASGIVMPSNNDVLHGRGPTIFNHPGNVKFRSIIDTKRMEYVQAKKNKIKEQVAREVYSTIRGLSPPGRFLRKESDGLYYIQDEGVTMAKIKQSLRENSHAIKDKIEIAKMAKKYKASLASEQNVNKEKESENKARDPPPFPPLRASKNPKAPTSSRETNYGNQKPTSTIGLPRQQRKRQSNIDDTSRSAKKGEKKQSVDPHMRHVLNLLMKPSFDDNEKSK